METITKDKVRHKKFTREEDKILKKLVAVHGSSNWIKIASLMEDRNSRQCRERWLNYLSPKLNKSEWTEEEDEFLLEMIQHTGKHWVKIASFFPGRTDQMLKNRYYRLINHRDATHSMHEQSTSNSHYVRITRHRNPHHPDKSDTKHIEEIKLDIFETDANWFISNELDHALEGFEQDLSKSL